MEAAMMHYYFGALISLVLLFSVVHGHGSLTSQEIYWASALPNIPMPSVIRDLLPDGKSNGKTITVPSAKPDAFIIYNYEGKENEAYNDPKQEDSVSLCFQEKDLFSNAKLKVGFTTVLSDVNNNFISRQSAKFVPFSSSKFYQILDHFKIKPESKDAETMKETIKDCEIPSISGEKKYCATSLESMVEFSMSTLGTNKIKVLSNSIAGKDIVPKQYTILSAKNVGNEVVACHSKAFAYAVFYCHSLVSTKAYSVQMVGENGAKVEAMAVCHTNTKNWSPNHVAFKVLKVKPGTVPVCHFIPQDTVLWIRNS